MTSYAASAPARKTIIKRKYTENFTVMPNRVFHDERLSLDELGLLAWLRSQPDNWQVWPNAIAKRFGMGRDRTRRIFRSLIETGWVSRQMERSEDGTFEMIVYYVYDEPAPRPMPPAGFDVDDDEEEGGEGEVAEVEEEGEDAGESVAAVPQTAFPATDDPAPVHPSPELSNDKIQNLPPLSPPNGLKQAANWPLAREVKSAGPPATPPVSTGRGPPSCDGAQAVPSFADLVRVIGTEPISRHDSERKWLRMPDRDRIDAVRCWPKLVAERAAQKWKLPDVGTYLHKRMWERCLVAAAPPKPAMTVVKPPMPAFFRWLDHYGRTRGPMSVLLAKRQAERFRGMTVPSEFPPGGEQPREPDEELRAAVLIATQFSRREDQKHLAVLGSEEFRAWMEAAKRFGLNVPWRDITDFNKPLDDPDREVKGLWFPSRWPPGMEPGDAQEKVYEEFNRENR